MKKILFTLVVLTLFTNNVSAQARSMAGAFRIATTYAAVSAINTYQQVQNIQQRHIANVTQHERRIINQSKILQEAAIASHSDKYKRKIEIVLNSSHGIRNSKLESNDSIKDNNQKSENSSILKK